MRGWETSGMWKWMHALVHSGMEVQVEVERVTVKDGFAVPFSRIRNCIIENRPTISTFFFLASSVYTYMPHRRKET